MPFRMLISLLEADTFLGRLVSGRVLSGQVKANQTVTVLGADGAVVELAPGDWIDLPAGLRHRVAWTAPGTDTIWLAVFRRGPGGEAAGVREAGTR